MRVPTAPQRVWTLANGRSAQSGDQVGVVFQRLVNVCLGNEANAVQLQTGAPRKLPAQERLLRRQSGAGLHGLELGVYVGARLQSCEVSDGQRRAAFVMRDGQHTGGRKLPAGVLPLARSGDGL